MSVVGAFYYLRIIVLMYFYEPVTAPPPAAVGAGGVRLALGLNAAAVIALGVFPGALLNLCARLLH
jgi:NADH-quinone oxidoreductase subunit N